MKAPESRQILEDPSGALLEHINPDKADGTPPLIAINGLGSGLDPWGDFLENIDHHVVAIDLRKAVGNHAVGLWHYSRALKVAMDNQGITQAHVMGFSWGGLAAIDAAMTYPQRFKTLTTIASPPGVSVELSTPVALQALGRSDRDLSDEAAGEVYGGAIRRYPGLLDQLGIRRPIDKQTHDQQLGSAPTGALNSARLWMSSIERLVVVGTDDPITPYSNAKAFYRLNPAHTHLYTHEGEGHYLALTHPEETGKAVGRFLHNPSDFPAHDGSGTVYTPS